MRKIAYSPYTLAGKQLTSSGVLLRVVFDDQSVGYADCHPWVHLGDRPVLEQLEGLRRGLTTPLTARSLYFARIDAKARSEQKHLFEDLVLPESHVLLHDLPLDQIEFLDDQKIKIKVGKNISREKGIIKDFCRGRKSKKMIRLDANHRFDLKACRQFLRDLEPYLDQIDFFEDPCPYHPNDWRGLQDEFQVPLAKDFQSDLYLDPIHPHQVSIVKPALQDPVRFLHDHRRIIFTSYLDHPLGQLAAAWVAAHFYKQHSFKVEICGLATHLLYDDNLFSQKIQMQENRLAPSFQGTGFGFDDLLEQLDWYDD